MHRGTFDQWACSGRVGETPQATGLPTSWNGRESSGPGRVARSGFITREEGAAKLAEMAGLISEDYRSRSGVTANPG